MHKHFPHLSEEREREREREREKERERQTETETETDLKSAAADINRITLFYINAIKQKKPLYRCFG